MARHGVLVVGAGPAGLGAAAALRRAGLDPVVIDRSDSVGSAWRTRYDSFRLHTIRWLSGLPGMPIPRAYGSWVRRDDFVRYLEAYANRFQIAPRFATELVGLDRVDDGWLVTTSAGEIEAQRVVLATGACSRPDVPDWPGRGTFTPPLIHSADYRLPDAYRGQRVLVVGSGNSATEVAVDLSGAGVAVELAVRTPPAILRRDTWGIPTQPLGIALRRAPDAIANPLGATFRRLTIPNLTAQGLPAPTAPYSQFRRTGTIPVLDHGFVAAVRSGAITVRAGVAELDGSEVVHSDGSRSTPDAVIAATRISHRPGADPRPVGAGRRARPTDRRIARRPPPGPRAVFGRHHGRAVGTAPGDRSRRLPGRPVDRPILRRRTTPGRRGRVGLGGPRSHRR